MAYDFMIFWHSARAILDGLSPYSVVGNYPPPPFSFVMLPFALLPANIAFIVWTLLSILALIILSKKKAVRMLLFTPVAITLFIGQIDLIILALGLYGGWLGLALISIKPQLAIWIIPFMFYRWIKAGEQKKIIYTLTTIAIIYILPTLYEPSWWKSWMISKPSLYTYSSHAASLFGLQALLPFQMPYSFIIIVLIGAPIVLFMLSRYRDKYYWECVALVNPISNYYSLTVLTQKADWIAIGLSWILLFATYFMHTGLPWIVLPIYLIIKSRIRLPSSINIFIPKKGIINTHSAPE